MSRPERELCVFITLEIIQLGYSSCIANEGKFQRCMEGMPWGCPSDLILCRRRVWLKVRSSGKSGHTSLIGDLQLAFLRNVGFRMVPRGVRKQSSSSHWPTTLPEKSPKMNGME
ncbi:unnamed protein product [Larinioides sclopetarius]|uniref:Uncharacterized protein n=1 Tax=Larinioides sclopetarius TaxID=280406 RepID=A0AAV2B9E1_9ARAC